MTYRFAKDPDEQTINYLQRISQLDEAQTRGLLNAVVSFLSSSNGDALIASLQSLSASHGVPVATLKNMARSLIVMLKGAFQNNLNGAQFTEDLTVLGLSSEQVEMINLVWRKSQSSLTNSTLGKTLMVNKLLLPEWRFGITAANKDLKNVGTTWMQLKLVLDRGDGQKSYEYVEMTLPQFYEFLATMEKAKAQLDFFS